MFISKKEHNEILQESISQTVKCFDQIADLKAKNSELEAQLAKSEQMERVLEIMANKIGIEAAKDEGLRLITSSGSSLSISNMSGGIQEDIKLSGEIPYYVEDIFSVDKISHK